MRVLPFLTVLAIAGCRSGAAPPADVGAPAADREIPAIVASPDTADLLPTPDASVPDAPAAETAPAPDAAPPSWDSCGHPPQDGAVRNGQPEFLDIDLTVEALDAHEGQRLRFMTFDYRNGIPLADAIAPIRNGQVQMDLPSGYYEFSYQQLYFQIDVDGDGRCDPAKDHVWSSTTSALRGTRAVLRQVEPPGAHRGDPRFASVCTAITACRPPR